MPEDRTDRSVAKAKQKEDHEKQDKECAAMQYAEAQLQEVKERQKQEEEGALLEQEEKAVEE